MNKERLQKQLDFIIEIDKIKHVFRQTMLMDRSRKENDAEHSWHLAIMAMLLQEYANEKVNILHVIKMVLIHDLVEIDAGDTFCYDIEGNKGKFEREKQAADRIFNILPQEQAKEIYDLWIEFENMETPESKFAAALDRLQPLLHNYHTQGQAWKEHDVQSSSVFERNKLIENGSKALWEYTEKMIKDAVEKGYLKK